METKSLTMSHTTYKYTTIRSIQLQKTHQIPTPPWFTPIVWQNQGDEQLCCHHAMHQCDVLLSWYPAWCVSTSPPHLMWTDIDIHWITWPHMCEQQDYNPHANSSHLIQIPPFIHEITCLEWFHVRQEQPFPLTLTWACPWWFQVSWSHRLR